VGKELLVGRLAEEVSSRSLAQTSELAADDREKA
jgi:hypothetical protein